mmetsp:Transcript_8858/g.36588  ORF Transcript_8858/g.36588 Transcript_8858/m.36588 type:complete len:289 (-) Transcript_8858:670-1536(-)
MIPRNAAAQRVKASSQHRVQRSTKEKEDASTEEEGVSWPRATTSGGGALRSSARTTRPVVVVVEAPLLPKQQLNERDLALGAAGRPDTGVGLVETTAGERGVVAAVVVEVDVVVGWGEAAGGAVGAVGVEEREAVEGAQVGGARVGLGRGFDLGLDAAHAPPRDGEDDEPAEEGHDEPGDEARGVEAGGLGEDEEPQKELEEVGRAQAPRPADDVDEVAPARPAPQRRAARRRGRHCSDGVVVGGARGVGAEREEGVGVVGRVGIARELEDVEVRGDEPEREPEPRKT